MDDMAVELTDKHASDIDVVRTRTVTDAGGFPDEVAAAVAARLGKAKSPAIIVGGDVGSIQLNGGVFGPPHGVVDLLDRVTQICLARPSSKSTIAYRRCRKSERSRRARGSQ